MTIKFFQDEYRFLSNFYSCRIEYEGLKYPSVEHAYQAAKTLNTADKLLISMASNATEAKRRGRYVQIRPDWDEVKLGIMAKLLIQKFNNVGLANKLLMTNGLELIEGNYWHDLFWGKCYCSKHYGLGDNNLGQLLMEVRKHAKAAADEGVVF